MTKRKCPICLSKKLELIDIVVLEAYDDYPINGPYILTKCCECSFYFHNTHIKQTDLDEYYISLSKYENASTVSIGSGGLTELDKKRLVKTYKTISEWTPNRNAKILDVGCAAGGLLQVFKSEGYENIYGTDPSHYCAKFVVDTLKCPVYEGSFLEVNIDQKFDVIIITHVLEHILDVRAFIEKIRDLLIDGGFVYIECPDATKYNRVIHSPYQEFNTEHINHFSPTDYQNLAQQLNLNFITSGFIQFSMETGNDYYASYSILRNELSNQSNEISQNEERDSSISEYINASQVMLETFNNFMSNCKFKRIALLGIGQLSFKLIPILSKYDFELELYDNDSRNWGKKINNLIVNPGVDICRLSNEGDAILISSMISFVSILKGLEMAYNTKGITIPEILSLNDIFSSQHESI